MKMMSAFGFASGIALSEAFWPMQDAASKTSEHSKNVDDGSDGLAKPRNRPGKATASAVPSSLLKNMGFSP
jgi:hypothetical protein